MRETDDREQEIARRFLDARAAAIPLDGYPGALPGTLDEAYRVQDAAIAANGRRIAGWKVGRILPPLDGKFGTDRLAGPIFADGIVTANGSTPPGQVFAGGFAAAEAEFLFRIGAAPAAGKTSFTLDEAESLVTQVNCGIEIASSPLSTINAIGPIAVISDFGNNNGLIVGPEVSGWRDRSIGDWNVTLSVDGAAAGKGRASAFPDGPLGAVRFLLELLARRGIAIDPGTWISSGAITGVHAVAPGQTVEARFGDEFTASCTIEAAGTH